MVISWEGVTNWTTYYWLTAQSNNVSEQAWSSSHSHSTIRRMMGVFPMHGDAGDFYFIANWNFDFDSSPRRQYNNHFLNGCRRRQDRQHDTRRRQHRIACSHDDGTATGTFTFICNTFFEGERHKITMQLPPLWTTTWEGPSCWVLI